MSDPLDLSKLRLAAGGGRRVELTLTLKPFELGGERYTVDPERVPATLDISKTTGGGYAFRLRFDARLTGPCMRCLATAEPLFEVEAREVSQPGGGDELQSPYVHVTVLDINAWSRDALALTVPTQILCKDDCAGLCAVCGADLNIAGPDHVHESSPDPRWAKLSEIRFDNPSGPVKLPK
jgi:uncharacterized protein